MLQHTKKGHSVCSTSLLVRYYVIVVVVHVALARLLPVSIPDGGSMARTTSLYSLSVPLTMPVPTLGYQDDPRLCRERRHISFQGPLRGLQGGVRVFSLFLRSKSVVHTHRCTPHLYLAWNCTPVRRFCGYRRARRVTSWVAQMVRQWRTRRRRLIFFHLFAQQRSSARMLFHKSELASLLARVPASSRMSVKTAWE